MLLLIFWTNCYLLDQLRVRKKSFRFYFTFTYSFFSALLSSRRSELLTYIIFHLSKELPLTFLARQVYWQQILLIFVCLRKSLFLLHFFLNKFIYFIYLFLAALGLHCCMRAFSSCGEWGLLFIVVRGLLIVAGFSLWLLLLRSTGSRRPGFSSCSTEAQ